MRLKNALPAAAVLVGAGAAVFVGAPSFKSAEPTTAYASLASQNKLGRAYRDWQTQHEKNGGDHHVTMALGWNKGLSNEHSYAGGTTELDLVDGKVAARLSNLGDLATADLWLVDNQEGDGKSVMPEQGDKFIRVGTLAPGKEPGTLELSASLGRALEGFEVDVVVVTRSGKTPVESRVLTGSSELFQRLYTQVRTASLGDRTWSQRVLDLFVKPAHAALDAVASLDQLVINGANTFFNEKFAGNGRTCGTCHRQENNLTIDPAFIATLPANDPLFVAEFTPALSQNFEKPQLMRRFGLILENVDGFENLATKFTMRGVPHTLALRTSLAPAVAGGCGPTNCTPQPIDGTTLPPNQRTGWDGGGAPGSGTLREFATGAVTQHFTKTLQRRPGIDFRLPTDAELDAMEAFQLFTGRDAELALGSAVTTPQTPGLIVKGTLAQRGQQVFMNQGGVAANCNVCHLNAGATFATGNANFDSGVESAPNAARQLDPTMPRDGGFGRNLNESGTFGNGTFNIPTLVEAADTGPFFHNNAVTTIEDAVKFYSTPAFNNSPAGQQGFGPINLTNADSNAVAAFLRVLNALENIRATQELVNFVKANELAPKTTDLLTIAMAETDDALAVLVAPGGNLSLAATHDLNTARQTILIARANPPGSRGAYIDHANVWLNLAKGELRQ